MQNNMELIPEFQILVDKAKERNAGKPMRIAIAGADAENILQGAFWAQEEGFAEPILIGNYKKISQTLEKLGLSEAAPTPSCAAIPRPVIFSCPYSTRSTT